MYGENMTHRSQHVHGTKLPPPQRETDGKTGKLIFGLRHGNTLLDHGNNLLSRHKASTIPKENKKVSTMPKANTKAKKAVAKHQTHAWPLPKGQITGCAQCASIVVAQETHAPVSPKERKEKTKAAPRAYRTAGNAQIVTNTIQKGIIAAVMEQARQPQEKG